MILLTDDSTMSETSHTEELADISESKETLPDDAANLVATEDDTEERNETLDNTEKSGEDELSYQDADKVSSNNIV